MSNNDAAPNPYATLMQLSRELRHLEETQEVNRVLDARYRSAAATRAKARGKAGGGSPTAELLVVAVNLPGIGLVPCNAAQRDAIRYLLDAYLENPAQDVSEAAVMLAAKKGGRLRDLFDGHKAWGRLIVSGNKTATFRLALPGFDDDGPGDEITREPWNGD